MRIFRVSGFHNTGKTTVVESILPILKERGYTVSTMKNIHIEGWSIDQEGKDTKRHAQAGAQVVGIVGLDETVLIYPNQEKKLSEMLSLFSSDYLILEGFSSESSMPNIVCAITEAEVSELVTPGTFCISGIVSISHSTKIIGRPVLNPLENSNAIVDLVEKNSIEA